MNFGPLTAHCPICGKLFVTMWQEFWTYRRGATFYCSENCLQIDLNRDLNMLKEARKKRKDRFTMTKLKKDGTPAKKPGPKPKDAAKKPEIDLTISSEELTETDIPEKTELSDFKAIINPLEVAALKSRVLRLAKYEIAGSERNAMRLVYDAVKDNELLLKKESWIDLAEEILTALDQLGVTE